jgi:hypothetical protein
MPEVLNISHWNQRLWFNTGGTRAKRLLHNPENDKIYYFKKSADKFPYEFWSEIIAYELGQILQLDVLKYEVAVFENEIGCVSLSMIDSDEEELIEGGKYLQAHYPEFSPDDKKLRHQYTFQLIEETFVAYKLEHFIENILKIIVFDALIGNSDRHQENWAFISNYTKISKALGELENSIRSGAIKHEPKWFQNLIKLLKVNQLYLSRKLIK